MMLLPMEKRIGIDKSSQGNEPMRHPGSWHLNQL